MTREEKDSLVKMLAKVPITETRGSLLSVIGKLLHVIDISESSIMIPTLLRDKCEFDAYEMLTLAKILKASILGHNDLVEFYMSESSSQKLNNNNLTLATQLQQHQLQQQLQHQHQIQSQNYISNNNSTNSTNSSNGNNKQYHNYNHYHHNNSSSSGNSSNNTSTSLSSGNNYNMMMSNYNSLLLLPQHPTINASTSTTTPSLRSSSTGQSSSISATSSSRSTPMPQAETIGNNRPLELNNGDPDATVRLLLQIEQLKIFIPQVTGLFESIIELYKNSVDTITR